jgi:hypothetical protein
MKLNLVTVWKQRWSCELSPDDWEFWSPRTQSKLGKLCNRQRSSLNGDLLASVIICGFICTVITLSESFQNEFGTLGIVLVLLVTTSLFVPLALLLNGMDYDTTKQSIEACLEAERADKKLSERLSRAAAAVVARGDVLFAANDELLTFNGSWYANDVLYYPQGLVTNYHLTIDLTRCDYMLLVQNNHSATNETLRLLLINPNAVVATIIDRLKGQVAVKNDTHSEPILNQLLTEMKRLPLTDDLVPAIDSLKTKINDIRRGDQTFDLPEIQARGITIGLGHALCTQLTIGGQLFTLVPTALARYLESELGAGEWNGKLWPMEKTMAA